MRTEREREMEKKNEKPEKKTSDIEFNFFPYFTQEERKGIK